MERKARLVQVALAKHAHGEAALVVERQALCIFLADLQARLTPLYTLLWTCYHRSPDTPSAPTPLWTR